MEKLEKAIKYADKLWKQQPNQLGIMPDLGNEFMWVVEFMQEQADELETLKKDVARFMAMDEFSGINEFSGLFTNTERKEYMELRRKLSKVGKEK